MNYRITYEFFVNKMSKSAKEYYNELKDLSQKGRNFVHHKTPAYINGEDKYHIENALKLEGYFGVGFDFGATVIGYGFLESGRKF